MHPAYSVILFTTASGAGSGCSPGWRCSACWMPCRRIAGWAVAGLGCAFVLVTGGLVASTAHLGRPERAWRAFSQWRTSWLSREGVMAVATYVPAGVLARRMGGARERGRPVRACRGAGTIVCAVLTLYSHGHDLRLPAHHPAVAPAADGAHLRRAGAGQRRRAAAACCSRSSAKRPRGRPGWRSSAWSSAPRSSGPTGCASTASCAPTPPRPRPGSATSARCARSSRRIRQPNFVMREMGYRVARKHALKLRRLTLLLRLRACPSPACCCR